MGDGRATRRTRKGQRDADGPATGETPQGLTGTWEQAKGNKGGDANRQDTVSDADTRRGEPGRAAEASRRWVRAASRWIAIHDGRGGGDQVQEKGATALNATGGGVVG